MSFWWWVLIFVGIAVVGLGLYAVLGLSLSRRVRALMADVGRLSSTLATLETTLGSGSAGAAVADDDPF